MKEIKFTIPGEVVYLSKIREFIKEKALEGGLDSKVAWELEFAVSEACTNIMEHGYKFEKGKEITVAVQVNGSKFLVTVLDHSKPFDPTSVKLLGREEITTDKKARGYGIYLIRKIMDVVEYKVKPGVGNELRLTKYLRKTKERDG